ncbi:MAG: O-antigen ligase family protein [Candidatus Magasanikbacteria bacterium]
MLNKIKKTLFQVFLFLLPFQTIFIVQEQFLNGSKWQYGTLGFYLTEILLWCLIILFIIDYFFLLKKKEIKIQYGFSKEKLFSIAILFFLLYLIFNTFFVALNLQVAWQMTRWFMLAFLLFIILISGFLKLPDILWPVVLGSILPSILGIWQFLFQYSFANKFLGIALHAPEVAGVSVIASDQIGRWLRAYGSFNHPNIFGGYLVLVIIFTFLLLKKIESKKQKIFLVSILLLQTMALFFSFSRTAWLVWLLFVFFILSYYLIIKKRIVWSVFFSLIFFGILFFTFFNLVQNRVELKSTYETKSISERVSGYREALEIWNNHKYLGVGPGNYTLASHNLDTSKNGSSYQPVHNIFFLFIVENGIIGFILFCFILITFFIYYFSIANKKRIAYGVFLGIIYLILGIFDHYLVSSYVGLMLLVLYLAVISRLSTE